MNFNKTLNWEKLENLIAIQIRELKHLVSLLFRYNGDLNSRSLFGFQKEFHISYTV